MDDVLEQACSTLPSDRLRFLVPKIVLINEYYKANLLKYLDKPHNNKLDSRLGYYRLVAQVIQNLHIDSRIKDIQIKAPRLCAINLEDVVKLCNDVSEVVEESTGKTSIVFASKLLHFSSPDIFPILDNKAEKKLTRVLKQLDNDANEMIDAIRATVDKELFLDLWYKKYRGDYNEQWRENIEGLKLLRLLAQKYPDHNSQIMEIRSPDRYRRFATDVFCLQQAIYCIGGPMYSFREIDKYLYWNSSQE